jgi:hypothetical protein
MNYLAAISNTSLSLFRGLLEKTQCIMNSSSEATVHVCAAEALWSFTNQSVISPVVSIDTLTDRVVVEERLRMKDLATESMNEGRKITEPPLLPTPQTRAASNEVDLPVAILALTLMPQEADEYAKAKLIDAIALIPMEERQKVVDLVRLLMPQETDGFTIAKLIDAIARIPMEERQNVVDLAHPLMSQETKIINKLRLLGAIANIPMRDRQNIVDLARPLMSQEPNLEDKMSLLAAISNIPMEERQNVIDMALPLIPQEKDGCFKAQFLTKIGRIPQEERRAVVEAALLLDLEIPVMERIDIAQQHLRRARLPLGEQPNLVNLAAAGINVHDDDRDRRTGEAIVLLRRYQGSINEEQILAAKNAFTTYLNASSRTPDIKQKAQKALEGTPRSQHEAYGSLIDGVEFGLRGPTIRGEELIGRLWIYAMSLSEKDSINVREGMISALANSYEFDGSRVCNPGKAQRLVIAVLQGNLKGVSIEEQRRENAPAPLNPSVTQFFNVEANRRIDNLQALLDAANQFLAENGLVDRENFLQAIRQYARATFE